LLVSRIETHIETINIHRAVVGYVPGWYVIECHRNGELAYRVFTDLEGLEEYMEYYPGIQGTEDPNDLTPISFIQELEVLPPYPEERR